MTSRLEAAADALALMNYRTERNSGDLAIAEEMLKAADEAEAPWSARLESALRELVKTDEAAFAIGLNVPSDELKAARVLLREYDAAESENLRGGRLMGNG